MIKKQYVSMRLLPIIVAFTLAFGCMAFIQKTDSYADESNYPTTALNVIGAQEEATWRILKTMPFKDHYDEWGMIPEYSDYEMGTPVERTWNNVGENDVVPWWSIKLDDLSKCGVITGFSLTSEDEYLFGYYASDIETNLNGTSVEYNDFTDDVAKKGYFTKDGKNAFVTAYDCYQFSGISYRKDTNRLMRNEDPYLMLDDEDDIYAEIYVLNDEPDEAKDDLNTVFTIYFNGAERELDLDATDMEVEEGKTNTRVAQPQSSYYGDSTVTYASDNEAVAIVDATGEVTGVAEGEANITASIKDGDKETSKSYKVVVTKAVDPAVVSLVEMIDDLPDPDKLTLNDKAAVEAARVAYDALSSEAKEYVDNITTLELAEATIAKLEAQAELAQAKEKLNEALENAEPEDDIDKLAGQVSQVKEDLEKAEQELKNLKDEIAAAKLTVSGLKVTSKSRKFTVTWKKNVKADGYQVQYKLKSANKYKTLKTVTKTKVVSKKFKKGKKYQFRVRTYKNIEGVKVYGRWSNAKTVICK